MYDLNFTRKKISNFSFPNQEGFVITKPLVCEMLKCVEILCEATVDVHADVFSVQTSVFFAFHSTIQLS